MKRRLGAGLLCGAFLLTGTPAALADPPGPTDYQSEVISIEPPAIGIDVEIIGGDSFVLLRVAPDVGTVEVVGYRGEPYLRFLPDGAVEENQRSPSKYLNEERYGTELPPGLDAAGEPDWLVVAEDGSYAWHDHRTHWMNPQPPPGRGPGDRVAEGVIPVLIDGTEVDVTVASTWVEPPSRLPAFVGFAAGLSLAVMVWLRRRVLGALLGLSLLAAATGTIAYFSVPAETDPAWSLWALPVTAAGLTMTVATLRDRVPLIRRRGPILLLLAALELVAWGIVHWGWLWAAILPTALPFWLDRLVAALVLAGALGVAATVVAQAGSERHAPTG
jgi:hypothetical protein